MRSWTSAALALLGSALTFLSPPAQAAGTTERVSLGMGGVQGNGTSYFDDISGDGRWVVFESSAGNLVAGNPRRENDIYLRDRQLGTTILISVHKLKGRSIAGSHSARMARGSRYVAFDSGAYDLVDGDTNQRDDVFVRDRLANRTILVSQGLGGKPADAQSYLEAFSPTGRFVVFNSYAGNLTTDAPAEYQQIYVRDLVTGRTTRESVNNQGAASDNTNYEAAVNLNGRYVAFVSSARNLVPADTNRKDDVFLRDRALKRIEVVSVGLNGKSSNGYSRLPAISDDGRYVAFTSNATDIVPQQTGGDDNAYLRDRASGTTRQIGLAPGGGQPDGDTQVVDISADGRYVLLVSNASNLVPNDTNGTQDLFVWDTSTNSSTRVDLSAANQQVDTGNYVIAHSYGAGISADGTTVGFEGFGSHYVPGDTNDYWDVFVRPR